VAGYSFSNGRNFAQTLEDPPLPLPYAPLAEDEPPAPALSEVTEHSMQP
jgi:hypothetical protein